MESTLFPPELLRMLISVLLVVAVVFANALFMVYAERKIAGHIQRRPGPFEVGWHGIIQTLVDGLKLMTKELVVPDDANRTLFRLAPLLSFTPVLMPFLVLPFSEKLTVLDLNIGLIFILAVSSLNVMAILVAGWSSNNKYGLFGAMRSVAQNIAYEIPILLSLLAVVLVTNTFSMKGIVMAQVEGVWFVLLQPVAFIIFFVCAVAETNRAPFDLPEAESELTAGFHTEYSGMGFGLFFLGEYTHMFIASSVATTVFLGGWSGLPLPLSAWTGAVWFLIKVYLLMFVMIWIRWTYPRVRFDQLMNLCWKYLIPFSLVNLILTAVIVKL